MSDDKVIHRVTLAMIADQTIAVHEASELLHAAPGRGQQSDRIDLWYTTYPGHETSQRLVHIIGTGGLVPPRAKHVSTVVMPDGHVWHVYDGGKFR